MPERHISTFGLLKDLVNIDQRGSGGVLNARQEQPVFGDDAEVTSHVSGDGIPKSRLSDGEKNVYDTKTG